MIYIGTAAWTIPKIAEEFFPSEGTHLERYAHKLNAVEINTSFYRDHQLKTYAKWSQVTPVHFRFSVKLNRRFTHHKLEIDHGDLKENIEGIKFLGEKFGVLLIQFPAGQSLDAQKMKGFYSSIREVYKGPIALEPRNKSWMKMESIELLREYNISKVKADPEKCPGDFPGEIEYFRLHGSPEIYKSHYSESYLEDIAQKIQKNKKESWCIFDNTTFGHATLNALQLLNGF